MSALEDMCRRLNSIGDDIAQMSRALVEESQKLRRGALHAADAARRADHPADRRSAHAAAQALHNAAENCARATGYLSSASETARSYVAAHWVSASGGGPNQVKHQIPNDVTSSDPETTDGDEARGHSDKPSQRELAVLKRLGYTEFEEICCKILEKRDNFFAPIQTRPTKRGRAGDGGIDFAGYASKKGCEDLPHAKRSYERIGVQCKRYDPEKSSKVKLADIREFSDALRPGDGTKFHRGIFISANQVTPGVKKLALSKKDPPIEIIDGSELFKLIRDYDIDIRAYVTDQE